MYQNFKAVSPNDNLAETLSPEYIKDLGRTLRQRTEDEYAARRQYMEIIRSSLNALGLTQYQNQRKDTGLESTIIDASYLHTWMQLRNEYTAELLPPFKIATTDIPHRNLISSTPEGNQLLQTLDMYANIIEEDINNKLNREWSDWLKEIEKAIGAAFLTGSSICKVYMDPFLNRPVIRTIPPENILIGENEKSIESAWWIGHVYTLNEDELDIYQAKGIFRAIDVPPDNETESTIDTLQIKTLEHQISGIDDSNSGSDLKKMYTFCEIQFWECAANNQDPNILSDNEELDYTYYPYTAHIHKETGIVMSLDPAWDKNAAGIEKRQTMFQFTYMESTDFHGIGLGQTCIGLHNTATNIFRNLTNSLALANSQTIIMSQNLAPQQSSVDLKYGSVNQIAAPTSDIKESMLPLPFQQPNPMYNEFLHDIRDLIGKVAGISSVTLENMPPNMQGNFLLALMDKESKPMSVVLQHFQFGINQMFKILQKLLREEWADKPILPELSPLTYGEVYSKHISIISSLDPSMSSSASQLVRMQTLLDCALQSPQLHNLTEVYKRLYTIMKIDNFNELLLPEEVIQKQQEEMAQQQQAQMAQQAQAAQQQHELLMTDIQNKREATLRELMLKERKAETDELLANIKIQAEQENIQTKMRMELLKEKGEVTKQKNIEISQINDAERKYILDSAQLKAQYGIDLPILPEPELESYNIDDVPLDIEETNNEVSGQQKIV